MLPIAVVLMCTLMARSRGIFGSSRCQVRNAKILSSFGPSCGRFSWTSDAVMPTQRQGRFTRKLCLHPRSHSHGLLSSL